MYISPPASIAPPDAPSTCVGFRVGPVLRCLVPKTITAKTPLRGGAARAVLGRNVIKKMAAAAVF